MQCFVHYLSRPVNPCKGNISRQVCINASINRDSIDNVVAIPIISTSSFNANENDMRNSIWLSENTSLSPQLIRLLGRTKPIARPAAIRRCQPPPIFAHAALSLVANKCSIGKRSPFSTLVQPYSTSVYHVQGCLHFPCNQCDARRFHDLNLGAYFKGLFRQAGHLAFADLSRFDLHHAHFFHNNEENALGLLFHAREYPAADNKFPHFLGHCQHNSTFHISNDTDMGLRTVLWVFGEHIMVLLDSTRRVPFGTIYESEFGAPIADLFFFDGCRGKPQERVNRGLYIVSYKWQRIGTLMENYPQVSGPVWYCSPMSTENPLYLWASFNALWSKS